jgi:hypothetical protein
MEDDMTTRSLWIALALIGTVVAQPASAQIPAPPPPPGPHFRFHVHAIFDAIPQGVTHWSATCSVYATPTADSGSAALGVGTGLSGSYAGSVSSGSLVVEVTVPNVDTHTLNSIRSYKCVLGLTGNAAGLTTFTTPDGGTLFPQDYKSERRGQVTGTIP